MTENELIEKLTNLEAIAYGYNINGEVLGMDCSDFEQIMVDSADKIKELLARAEGAEARAEEWKATAMANEETELSKAHDALSADWAKQKLRVKELEEQLEKTEKKLEAAVGTIYALIADCPPETCREICANHDGVCAKHAEMGHYDHCKGFKWIGAKEE